MCVKEEKKVLLENKTNQHEIAKYCFIDEKDAKDVPELKHLEHYVGKNDDGQLVDIHCKTTGVLIGTYSVDRFERSKNKFLLKSLTVVAATEYLKEWSDYEAIRKTASDDNFHYFDGKRKQGGIKVVLRFERSEKSSGEFWDVFEQMGSVWSWVDAKECVKN